MEIWIESDDLNEDVWNDIMNEGGVQNYEVVQGQSKRIIYSSSNEVIIYQLSLEGCYSPIMKSNSIGFGLYVINH